MNDRIKLSQEETVITVDGLKLYELIGVVCHQGRSLNAGHYVSFVRMGGVWHMADDANVRFI